MLEVGYTHMVISIWTERGDDTDRSVVGGDMTVSFIIIKLPLSASLWYPLEIHFFYLAVPFLTASSYCRRSQQSMYFLYVCKQILENQVNST
jgi:hypothetical protein